MVSKNEKSPDDLEKPDNNMLKGEGKDVQAGKSCLLQVPVEKTSSGDTLSIANINSLQADNDNRDMKNIIQEASGTDTTGNENTENKNTDLPEMKIKVESRKTEPVLETSVLEKVQFKNSSPETETKEKLINESVSKTPPFVEVSGTQNLRDVGKQQRLLKQNPLFLQKLLLKRK